MKRHPSLTPLSREHHGALILARLLQVHAPLYKGLPADAEGKAGYALTYYKEQLVKHFAGEEKVLTLVNGNNEILDLLTREILHEHGELRLQFEAIHVGPELVGHLDALGRDLEAHIRKEERELFPLIQETCSEELMTAIDESLSAHP